LVIPVTKEGSFVINQGSFGQKEGSFAASNVTSGSDLNNSLKKEGSFGGQEGSFEKKGAL
jgi:hypothetical protein